MKSNVLTSVLLILGGFGVSAIAADDAPESFSRANQLLFFTDHLRGVEAPSVLHYAYERKAPGGQGFVDRIDLQVKQPAAGEGKNVHVRYFTGPRARELPDLENVTGNPVLSLFLQRDVNQMAQATGGNFRYFQNRIKNALEASAEVKAVQVQTAQGSQPAHEVTIYPYRDPADKDKLGAYIDKQYRFVIAAALPGALHEMRSFNPGNSTVPAEEERVTYQGRDRGE
ncbi:MAG: hypothetical protein ACFCUJ_16605 [Thiotrichales bacterium]